MNSPHCQLREEGLALELFEDQSDVIRFSLVISDLDWFEFAFKKLSIATVLKMNLKEKQKKLTTSQFLL